MLKVEIRKTEYGKRFESLADLKATKGDKIAANAMRQIIGSDRWLKPIPAPDGKMDVSLKGFYFYFQTSDLVYDEAIQRHFGADLLHRLMFEAGSAPKCLKEELLAPLQALRKRLIQDGVIVVAAQDQGQMIVVFSERINHGGIH